MWDAAGDVLEETSKNRFRGKAQVNQWVFKFWQLAEGTFIPQSIHDGRCYHLRDKGVEDLCKAIKSEMYALICINDTDQTTEFEKKKEEIAEAFECILSEKSAFEL